MASVVGTPANIASGANYTPEAGSDRVVVMVLKYKYGGGGVTVTHINWNSINRIPAVAGTDVLAGDRDGVAICVFKESELPGGAAAATVTYVGSPSAASITCYTVDGIDQTSTVRQTNTSLGAGANPATCALASIVAGDICIGGLCTRNNGGGSFTLNNSFTSAQNADNGDGGQFVSGYKVAAATTETFSVTMPTADDDALAAIAIAPVAAGGGEVAATPHQNTDNTFGPAISARLGGVLQ